MDIETMSPAVQAACAARDIGAIFRFLHHGGMMQREIAELVRMSQPDVNEIIKGRQVQAYDVLVRVADGLAIPRGLMGLSYGEREAAGEVEEVDEDVERRKLIALAGTILFGVPIFA
ncbi:MAG: hypothetical protein JO287_16225 [Pseudonocardiales bacterium]|nr:hypothetical protein [Pseudonocardiales bacterium]